MELIFDFDQRQGLANVRFEGLDGTEDVASMKQALSLLKIRNPVIRIWFSMPRMPSPVRQASSASSCRFWGVSRISAL